MEGSREGGMGGVTKRGIGGGERMEGGREGFHRRMCTHKHLLCTCVHGGSEITLDQTPTHSHHSD